MILLEQHACVFKVKCRSSQDYFAVWDVLESFCHVERKAG